MDWSKIKSRKLILLVILLATALRFIDLGRVSLFGDELDVGYHAYSLLKTGRDYSGNILPLQPRSLAEWRTPLFIYSSVPGVAMFGISALGVRLLPAILGVLNVYLIYALFQKFNKSSQKVLGVKLQVYAALFLAISPWHIQYSRAAFEATQMLALLLFGLVAFLFSIENKGKYLWLSTLSFMLMPWTYNAPKLFIPLFLGSFFIIYGRQILKFSKINLVKAAFAGLLLGLPLVFNIVSGQGSARFSNISLLEDENLENIISEKRDYDSSNPRIYHNKFTYFTSKLTENYLTAFSPQFLFLDGDINLRHSISDFGVVYAVESILLILGLVYFFSNYKDRKVKMLIASWLLLAPIPSALTIDGATHATRLILMLPVIVIITSFGMYQLSKLFTGKLSSLLTLTYLLILSISFVFYHHSHMTHNPRESAKWWHHGWEESISYISENKDIYEKIIISTQGEPPWIFYSAYSELTPDKFHGFSPEETRELENFGEVSSIDNVYFASLPSGAVYEWGQVIDDKTLYLATAEEVSVDLVAEPERTPDNLNLLKSVAYPSGLPAFYLFSGK